MSKISENKSSVKTTKVKAVVAMTIAIGIALMTTLVAIPNTIETVQANPCSHNSAGNGGNGGPGGNGGSGGAGTGTGTGKAGGGTGFGVGTGLGFGATGAPGGPGGPGGNGGSISCIFTGDLDIHEGP